jgi:mono/diheme cytochrome c family protein
MKLTKLLPYLFVAVALVLTLCVGTLAFIDLSSEAEPSWLETRLASAALQIKLRLNRPVKSSPLPISEEDLVRGSELYEQRCAVCHGATRGRMAPLAKSFSPRPPQFVIQPAQKATWMDAYIIQHGIRWSAMPASRTLSTEDAWRLALYVEGRHEPRD